MEPSEVDTEWEREGSRGTDRDIMIKMSRTENIEKHDLEGSGGTTESPKLRGNVPSPQPITQETAEDN